MSLPEALSGEAGRTFAAALWLGVIVISFCFFMGAWNVIQAGILLAKAERNLKKADDDKRRRKPVKPDCKLSDGNGVRLHPDSNLLLVGGKPSNQCGRLCYRSWKAPVIVLLNMLLRACMLGHRLLVYLEQKVLRIAVKVGLDKLPPSIVLIVHNSDALTPNDQAHQQPVAAVVERKGNNEQAMS